MAKDKRYNPLKGIIYGTLAGAAGSAAMDGYWALVRNIAGDRPEQKPKGRGSHEKDEPSTQVIADKVSEALTGHEVPKKDKAAAGVSVHYATGSVYGTLFGVMAARSPKMGLLAGLAYGILIWLFLDEITLRVLNIAPDPEKVPPTEHLQAVGAHLVYGASTALLARLLLRIAP